LEGSDDLAYPGCNNLQQSPIDLAYAVEKGSSVIAIELDTEFEDFVEVTSDGDFKVKLGTNGKLFGKGTMELILEDGITVWRPVQFHFHAPAEHTVNGKRYDAEMHIVHLTP